MCSCSCVIPSCMVGPCVPVGLLVLCATPQDTYSKYVDESIDWASTKVRCTYLLCMQACVCVLFVVVVVVVVVVVRILIVGYMCAIVSVVSILAVSWSRTASRKLSDIVVCEVSAYSCQCLHPVPCILYPSHLLHTARGYRRTSWRVRGAAVPRPVAGPWGPEQPRAATPPQPP
jgi:hypothetical protein